MIGNKLQRISTSTSRAGEACLRVAIAHHKKSHRTHVETCLNRYPSTVVRSPNLLENLNSATRLVEATYGILSQRLSSRKKKWMRHPRIRKRAQRASRSRTTVKIRIRGPASGSIRHHLRRSRSLQLCQNQPVFPGSSERRIQNSHVYPASEQ